jgi:hypothetical protein
MTLVGFSERRFVDLESISERPMPKYAPNMWMIIEPPESTT